MKADRALLILSALIAALALVAAGTGVLWQGNGIHQQFTSLRGETVPLWGGGLYRFDSVSGASQEIAQDVVTLCLGVPLLIVATVLSARGSLRGKLLHAGTLGYFLYTYTSMSMLTAYNEFFLIYVALMSMSLSGFIMSLMAIDVTGLPERFTSKLPRKAIASFLMFVGIMLLLMWVGRIVLPALTTGKPPFGLEAYSTLVIQAMDLGLVAPAAIVSALLLFRRSPLGYLLSSVVLVKAFTMSIALIAMIISQMLSGVEVDPVSAVIFSLFSVLDVALFVLMLWSIRGEPQEQERVLVREAEAPPTGSILPAG
jgi:hypothetical protein